jgi:hypothetical protein
MESYAMVHGVIGETGDISPIPNTYSSNAVRFVPECKENWIKISYKRSRSPMS